MPPSLSTAFSSGTLLVHLLPTIEWTTPFRSLSASPVLLKKLVLRVSEAMAGHAFAWRKLLISSRFNFCRRISSTSSGLGDFDSPPVVCSRRVVVTGMFVSLHSMFAHVPTNTVKTGAYNFTLLVFLVLVLAAY